MFSVHIYFTSDSFYNHVILFVCSFEVGQSPDFSILASIIANRISKLMLVLTFKLHRAVFMTCENFLLF